MSSTAAAAPAAKDAHTRLLDLLAGWGAFLDERNSTPDIPGYREAVESLYQEAGAFGVDLSPMREMTDDEVAAFVVRRIVPLLLARS